MNHVPGVGGGVQAGPVDVVDRVEALREELVGPDGVVGDREAGNHLGEVIDGVGARVERGSRLPRVFVARHAFEEVSAHKVNGRRSD